MLRARRRLRRAARLGRFVLGIPVVVATVLAAFDGQLLWLPVGAAAVWLVAVLTRRASRGAIFPNVVLAALVVLFVAGSALAATQDRQPRSESRNKAREAFGLPPQTDDAIPIWFAVVVVGAFAYPFVRAAVVAVKYQRASRSPIGAVPLSAGDLPRRKGQHFPIDRSLVRRLKGAPYLVLAVAGWSLAVGLSLIGAAVAIALSSANVIGLIGFGLLAYAASRLYVRARRSAAAVINEVRRSDPRAPILYIRSFADEQAELARAFAWTEFLGDVRPRTLEEVIASEVTYSGPLIAIGRPGERLPPLGAAREHVSGERWQERIQEYLAEAQGIVTVLGEGAGLRWEWQTLASVGALPKLLVIAPPVANDVIRRRWEAFMNAVGELPSLRAVPEEFVRKLRALRLDDTGTVRGVACLDSDEDAYRIAIRLASAGDQAVFAATR